MIVPGLVSVTFRQKSIGEICEICRAAELSAVEWGGDVHVPPENIAAAREARRLSRDYGLGICSYGSYWRTGDGRDAFMRNLEAAEELGAPVIRVWWGRTGSAETAEAVRREWMEEMRIACRKAEKAELQVAPEFHPGTLTDTPGSLERLLRETADIPNLRYYWQPRWDWPEETRLETLDKLSAVPNSAWSGQTAVTVGGRTYTVASDVPCYNSVAKSWMTLSQAHGYANTANLYVSGGVVRVIEVGK